ncbi:MAG: hypothetical protein MZV65_35885 [Chromatiales bacterium]|nr:hypothetical protein [Chromatiales bacterium]
MIWFVLYNVIQPFADWLAYGLLALPHGSHLGESLAFFFYDVPKLLSAVGRHDFPHHRSFKLSLTRKKCARWSRNAAKAWAT